MKKEYVRKNIKRVNVLSEEIRKHSPSSPSDLLPVCKPCKLAPQE